MPIILTSGLSEIAKSALANEIMNHTNATGLNSSNVSDWIKGGNVGNLDIDKDDFINAWEHAYISGMLNMNTNSEAFAYAAGYLKEFGPGYFSNHPDAYKDLFNNAKGIELSNESLDLNDFSAKLFGNIFDISDKALSIKNNPGLILDLNNDDRMYNPIVYRNMQGTFTNLAIMIGKNSPFNNILNIFRNSLSISMPVDPLLVDLDGDGIETTAFEDGVFFDHANDGFAESSSWVGKDDGILVYDKNNNGMIDNGSELFGDNFIKADGSKASSGFDALSDFDSNNDGVINAQDTNFNDIKVLKGDGTLLTLEQAGIASINLSKQNTNTVDENGNTQLTQGTFITTDGQTNAIGDYVFQTDNLNSIATEYVDVPENIASLPDIAGSGTVYSLHQAMARDTSGELKELLDDFIAEGNSELKKELIPEIIYKWAGADEIAEGSRGNEIDAKLLYSLEKFLGQNFVGVENTPNPNREAANLLKGAFSQLSTYIYAQLESQTTLKTLFDLVSYGEDSAYEKNIFKLDAVQEHIDTIIATDPTTGKLLLSDFAQTFTALGFADESNYSQFCEHFSELGTEYKVLLETAGKILRYGSDNADLIQGTSDQEAVFGGAGNDTIYTRQGNDIVYGGSGNDYIDTCEDDDLVFGEDGNDTIIAGLGNDTVYGGAGDDSIDAGQGNNFVYGEDGNDYIETGIGNNFIDAGSGNDKIYLNNNNNDTIIGGKGDDWIVTYSGSTSLIIFNYGDGNDTIEAAQGDETIQFGEGLNKENFHIRGDVADVIMYFDNSNDSIRVKDFLHYTNKKIEKVVFADGSYYSYEDLLASLEIHGTEGNDSIQGSIAGEVIYGYGGNDTIYSGTKAVSIEDKYKTDTVYGGDGDDYIENNGSDGYLDGGSGNDTISSGSGGNDTIIGGLGNDDIRSGSGGNKLILFNYGDGNDTITTSQGNETIRFGEGLTKEHFKVRGNDPANAVFYFDNADDSIEVKDFLYRSNNKIEQVEFADGSSYTYEELFNMLESHGTDGNDSIKSSIASEVIYGYGGNDTIISGTDVPYIEQEYQGDTIYGGDGDDSIVVGGGNNFIYGENGNDYITGNNHDDYIDGGAGDDTIDVKGGNDTIIGGSGNDNIMSHKGEKLILFNLGDGNDTITTSQGNETIRFGEGLTKEHFKVRGNDPANVVFYFDNADDSIEVKDFLYRSNNKIEQVEFADGSSYTYEELFNMLESHGTDGNDKIQGSIAGEVIYGYGGNDTIYSGSKAPYIEGEFKRDTVYGGDGDDYIENDGSDGYLDGGSGNDTISSGSGGNDTIIGGLGNDDIRSGSGGNKLILFNYGDGNDTITTSQGNETIRFGEGLTKEHFKVKGVNTANVVFYFDNADDSIEVKDFLYRSSNKIEQVEFADGSIYTYEELFNMLETHGTDGNDNIQGSIAAEVIYGYGGNDTIRCGSNLEYVLDASMRRDTVYGGDGDDYISNTSSDGYLDGGSGNDTIDGGGGSDTIIGGTGDDLLRGENGNDLYLFSEGDGIDAIYDYSGSNRIEFNNTVAREDIAIFLDANNTLFIDYGQNVGQDVISIKDRTYSKFDSLTVKGESEYTISNSALNKLIQDMSAFASENGINITSVSDVKDNADLMNLVNSAWSNVA